MKVTVDQDTCIASGQCVLTTSEVFDQRDDDGIVVLVTSTPPESLSPDVHEAAALCPARAIQVAD
ncbi:ferredoxin [Kribbella italica]|uniref:Ferredoxin n=1 Tax=Kribbella italica TaxID=1540520 RepID=A0A7W9J278_9ACTN|nr:ferredoxin [Kribbella italica]MBB5834291.1 ferredoxin [Kribbella italica]